MQVRVGHPEGAVDAVETQLAIRALEAERMRHRLFPPVAASTHSSMIDGAVQAARLFEPVVVR